MLAFKSFTAIGLGARCVHPLSFADKGALEGSLTPAWLPSVQKDSKSIVQLMNELRGVSDQWAQDKRRLGSAFP